MSTAKELDIINETLAWLQKRMEETKYDAEKYASIEFYHSASHSQTLYEAFRSVKKHLQYQITAEERPKEPGFKHEYEAVWEADENDKIQAEAGGDAEMVEAEMAEG